MPRHIPARAEPLPALVPSARKLPHPRVHGVHMRPQRPRVPEGAPAGSAAQGRGTSGWRGELGAFGSGAWRWVGGCVGDVGQCVLLRGRWCVPFCGRVALLCDVCLRGNCGVCGGFMCVEKVCE